jgi:uncharacterized protein YbdZ (MbtH family)/aryl carrier-like protein
MTARAFYILDTELNQVDPGVPAELYLSEHALAGCHFSSGGAAAERFVADPFAGPGRRMYRTGEVVRQSRDGVLSPAVPAEARQGELAQVRLALANHPATRHVGAVRSPGAAGHVAAYVVVDSGGPAAAEWGELAAALLPQRLIPAALAVVSGLEFASDSPASQDRPAQERRTDLGADTLPALRALFAEVLQAPDAGLDDNFFDLGGQSVTAMLLIGRINKALGVQLSIADLFNAPTVRELQAWARGPHTRPVSPFDAEDALYTTLSSADGAHCLWPAAIAAPAGWQVAHGPAARADCLGYADQRWADERRADEQRTQPAGMSDPDPDAANVAPLSFNQQFFCGMDEGQAAGAFSDRHLLVCGWRLRGPLQPAVLQLALDDIVARHEILRTSIRQDRQPAYQVVHPPSRARLEIADLPPSAEHDRQSQCERLMTEVESGTMRVTELPLLRAVLGRLAADDHVLVLAAHHMAVDAWSMQLLIRDLASCYAIRRGFEQSLPPVRQYREYCLAQQEETTPAALRPALDYWRASLHGARSFTLPTQQVQAPAGLSRYAMRHFGLDPDLTRGVLSLARQTRSSPFMVLLSAFYLLGRELTGVTDLLVPTFTTGRHQARFLDTVGPFLNYLPVRTDVTSCTTFRQVLARTRASCLQAYAHDIPFERILPVAPDFLQASPGRSQVAFELVQPPAPAEGEAIGDLSYSEVHRTLMFEADAPDIPDGMLWVLSMVSATEIIGTVQYKRSEFTSAAVADLVDRYRRVLRQSVTAPDEQLSPLGAIAPELECST